MPPLFHVELCAILYPMSSTISYLQPYAKYGFTEDQVMGFLEAYASSGSVEQSAQAIGIPAKEGYKLVLLKDFQDQLRTYNALDSQKLDVQLTKAINKALKRSLEIIEKGTTTVMTKRGVPVEIDIPLKDMVGALDKVFRARYSLRESGTGVSAKESEELKKIMDKMKRHAESVVPVKGERIDDDSKRDS